MKWRKNKNKKKLNQERKEEEILTGSHYVAGSFICVNDHTPIIPQAGIK